MRTWKQRCLWTSTNNISQISQNKEPSFVYSPSSSVSLSVIFILIIFGYISLSLLCRLYFVCTLLCRSVLRGGSTAIFMFGYGIYFYFRSNMDGLMQLFFYIGYNACMSYAFFLILGTISFRASLIFIGYVYRAVKSEWTIRTT